MGRGRMSKRGEGRWRRQAPRLAAMGVAAAALLLSLPHALVRGFPGPDVLEHLEIANAWAHGAGFVDPVKWNYFLPEPPPLPAAAVRPPVVPALLALALALGASLRAVFVLHALLAAVVTAACFGLARRYMRTPSAAAAALLLAQSGAWVLLSSTPASEVTAVAAVLLVVRSAPGVARSLPGALAAVAAVLIASLVRPNLAALALAVAAACAWPRGARARAGVYLLCVLGLVLGLRWAFALATGLPLYAGYGVVAESLDPLDLWRYQREWVGPWAFARAHGDEILATIGLRTQQLVHALCLAPDFRYVGWLIPPGLVFAFSSRARHALELRVIGLSVVGFALIVIGNYAAFEAARYPLLVAAPGWLCGLAALDALLRRGEEPLRRRFHLRRAHWLSSLPLIVAVAAYSSALLAGTPMGAGAYTWERLEEIQGKHLRGLCPHIDRDAVLGAADPWSAAMWCGNASLRLPIDLTSRELQDRFLAEHRVRYLLREAGARYRWLEDAERFTRIATSGPFSLYELRDGDSFRSVWRAPPPPVCAGMGPECARELGRGR